MIVGTTSIETTRSFRRLPADQQWNPETLLMSVVVPLNPRGLIIDSPGGIRKVTSRNLWCKSTARQTVAQPAKEIHKSMCHREKQPGQPRSVVKKEDFGRVAEEAMPGGHATISEPTAIPPQPSSSSHEDPMQVNTTPRRLDMSAVVSELCQ